MVGRRAASHPGAPQGAGLLGSHAERGGGGAGAGHWMCHLRCQGLAYLELLRLRLQSPRACWEDYGSPYLAPCGHIHGVQRGWEW